MYKNLAVSLFLLLLMSGSVFFIMHLNTKQPLTEDEQHVDSIMQQAVYDQYNESGQLILHLSSPYVEHYSFNNSSFFRKPDIILYQENKMPWHISSLQGKSSDNNKLIDLQDDVVIYRAGSKKDPETTIHTTALTIDPKKQQAETNQAATIVQPHSIVQSIGLKTDFKTGVTQLSTNARVVLDGES